jgi:hypothetical protein
MSGHFRLRDELLWILVQQQSAAVASWQTGRLADKGFVSGLVGNPGVDLHGDRDLAVAEYPHRCPEMHVERGQQRGAGPAHSMRRAVSIAGGAASGGEVPGEVPRFVGPAVASDDHQAAVVPSLPSVMPPGCLLFGLELQRGNADRGQRQRGIRSRRIGFPVEELSTYAACSGSLSARADSRKWHASVTDHALSADPACGEADHCGDVTADEFVFVDGVGKRGLAAALAGRATTASALRSASIPALRAAPARRGTRHGHARDARGGVTSRRASSRRAGPRR